MAFDFRNSFESHGLTYSEFLSRHGTERDRHRWQKVLDAIKIPDPERRLIADFKRRMPVLVMAGAWCGDCARQCPIIHFIAEFNSLIELKFVDRDADSLLANELWICGSPRIPQTVMFDEDFNYVARFGERTMSQLRQLGRQLTGASCSTGIMDANETGQAVLEWIGNFEYAQLILRLSPRLRERHGD